MHITFLTVTNFRSFVEMEPIELSRMNVFVGPNNAGKSSLLRAAYMMQGGAGNVFADVRVGAPASSIEIGLSDLDDVLAWSADGTIARGSLRIGIQPHDDRISGSLSYVLIAPNGEEFRLDALPQREPDHVLVPYFSRRKAAAYHESVSEEYALQVSPQFNNLAARLSRLGNATFPAGQRYRETCEAILGFVVTAVPSTNGQRPGAYLPDRRTIPLDQMGEGVPNIAGLLADLALSENKILLVEEPENDLHPHALKALLDLIEESAESNQILVSTHSNIVTRHLGAVDDSRLFYVDCERGVMPPVANVRRVEPTAQARLAVLRELGYTFSDFDLWDGWLILEESSAERIIRDYLIPWFAPKLARVRTLAVGGNSQIEPTFQDFHRLVRFTHLEEAYRDAAWIRVDGDTQGETIVSQLRDQYPSWTPDRFGTFSEVAFEQYYPDEFAERVGATLAEHDKQARRVAKRQLLADVRKWLDEDSDRGQAALATSAEFVIKDLKKIETQLNMPS